MSRILRGLAVYLGIGIGVIHSAQASLPDWNHSTSPAIPSGTDDSLTPTSPNVVYANGWSELTLIANYAKTTVTTSGHFLTNRNACGRDAYGVLTVEVWNQLATYLNQIAESTPGTQKTCVAAPDSYPFMDGDTQLKLTSDSSKDISLYHYENDQICNSISDQNTAMQLLTIIQKILISADKEDCPNGWGS